MFSVQLLIYEYPRLCKTYYTISTPT